MKSRIVKKLSYVIGAISLIALIGAIQPAMALVGPEESPPSGVTIADTEVLPSHPDYGEQWGRSGGRTLTFTFTETQLLEYEELRWEPVSIGIAFDSAIDSPDEDLDYDSSPTITGQAVYTGQTVVEVFNGSYYEWKTVATQFILTVTDYQGDPVPLAFDSGLPYVDVLNLPANLSGERIFNANLKMEAWNLGSPYVNCNPVSPGSYGPALNVFDCYRTRPTAAEHAITEFIWGFFYELAEDTLSMEDHDAHMAALVGGVQVGVDYMSPKLGYLYDEWDGVKGELFAGHTSIENGIEGLGMTLDGHSLMLDQLRGNTETIDSKVVDLASQVSDLNEPLGALAEQIGSLPDMRVLLYLFGIDYTQFGFPPHPYLPPFEEAREASALYQAFDSHIDLLSTELEEKGQMIADLQSQMTSMYTQEQLDQAVASAVAAKDQQISELISAIATMFSQEQVDQLIAATCPGHSEGTPAGPKK